MHNALMFTINFYNLLYIVGLKIVFFSLRIMAERAENIFYFVIVLKSNANKWIFIVITYSQGIEKGKVTRGLALTLPCVIIC